MSFKPTTRASIDTETTGLRLWHGHRPFAVPMVDQDGEVHYTEWSVDPFTREVIFDCPQWELDLIFETLRNDKIDKEFHNSKFDVRGMDFSGFPTLGKVWDSVYMARVYNNLEWETGCGSFGLKPLSKWYCNIPEDDQTQLKEAVQRARMIAKRLGWKIAEGKAEFGDEPWNADYWIPGELYRRHRDLCPESWEHVCKKYAITDVFRTRLLTDFYKAEFDKDPCLWKTYDREMELWHVTYAMEGRGVAIDLEVNKRLQMECDEKMAVSLERMQVRVAELRSVPGWVSPVKDKKAAKKPFNPASPKQLQQVLYASREEGGFGFECTEFTDKGAPSTDANALKPHINHPFVQDLHIYRAYKKGRDTFFDKYEYFAVPCELVPGVYCLHPTVKQEGALTGRLSMADPNLQQVSNPETHSQATEVVNARLPFVPRPGYRLYMGDYAQQEARILAFVANVRFMIEATLAGKDINTEGTNRVWGGRGNYAGYKVVALALELGSPIPAPGPSYEYVKKAWDELGWNSYKALAGAHSAEAILAAEKWLEKYDFKVDLAEKALNKKNSRGRFKQIMFCYLYGGGPETAAMLMGVSLREATDYFKEFDRQIPEVKQYMTRLTKQARKDGYVFNCFGRKLRVNPQFAYRCVNYVVQGTAADLMKVAMIKIHEYLRSTGLDAHIWLTIHDELAFEIKEGHNYKWLLRGIKSIMEDTQGAIGIPMEVELKRAVGSWANKVDVAL